jgi:hypothetical protein
MKITSVLTAVNNNPKYTRFIPFFIEQWQKLYPNIKIKIVFIGSSIPSNLEKYKEYILLFPEIPNISSVYIAQTIRILYPALLDDSEVTVITDMDMVPGNRTYFQQEIEEGSFTIFRPLECVGQGEIAICYNAAQTSVWKSIFGINNIDDVRSFLIKKYKYSDGIHGGKGWTTDQLLLFNAVANWTCGKRNIIGDSQFRRLDFFHHKYDKNKFIEMLNTELYSDAHFYADLCPWSDI